MNILNQTIKDYKFISFINKGGFGAVYKAQKATDFFAIKVFHEEYVLREYKKHGENNRLQREIEIMKSVSHEYLVEYVDDFIIEDESGKNYFLVMKFIEGHNLREILNQEEKLNEEKALELFKQILEGLDYLHNHKGEDDDTGIIHRDLKPENIIIQNNGQIKIVDFGISKVIDFTSLTSTGEIFGTGPYMSPEQITDSKHLDKRSDLYTAGVILYEILTGYYPYDFQYFPELIEKIKNDPAIPPRRRNLSISNQIENVILKLLEKNPYQRFLTIDEILKAVNPINTQREKVYDLSPRFLLRLYNDKSVLEKYTKHDEKFGYVVFPANLENNQPGLRKNIQDNPNIKILVDPATVRLAYDTYTDVKGVLELPYAPNDYSVITPTYLESYKAQKEYVKKVIDKQIELQADILLSPFHYTNNSTISYGPTRNLTAEWLDLDCKLAKESIDYRNNFYPNKEIYTGICIKADILKDDKDKKFLLNTFSSFENDGFLIYADTIDTKTNEVILYHYIDFLIELQKWTNKPVIAGRINTGLGLGLLSLGLSGFTSGTARFESFYEDLYKESSKAFNMYTRYYFPELLTTVSINRKTPIKFDEIIKNIGACDCYYCNKKANAEIVKDQNAHLHFLEIIHTEIAHLQKNSINTNIMNYINKIDVAISLYSGLKNVFKSDEYSFLYRWKNVFTKIKDKHYV
ncbi:serine/threonine-protein kinase [Sulfurospirillum barnesii]|uniref:Serine/threonine protein kinase n=1 Tax=Sulfurospirillum barnesii (strain ATCC 700032 / DSM 10660 / SES-3) TaxID=760154 RepID=I3XV41_SULBS|nr:serine/threonine-protein kinase [Sulfurospirillum barnesii]AFL67815.1 serine/threonine protein kinase [Sulfurospirillum barnesii SES-3]